jgi:hypothetical protein
MSASTLIPVAKVSAVLMTNSRICTDWRPRRQPRCDRTGQSGRTGSAATTPNTTGSGRTSPNANVPNANISPGTGQK